MSNVTDNGLMGLTTQSERAMFEVSANYIGADICSQRSPILEQSTHSHHTNSLTFVELEAFSDRTMIMLFDLHSG